MTHPANITCVCERGPREVICHTDDAGVSSWSLAAYCSDCYEDGSCFVHKAESMTGIPLHANQTENKS